ncbi:MAG: hypothetical protein K9N51_07935 [Candidatus Pacebacteria bacterium]|nr:hypothetical protein [Candidatus Paceibacterota bacterium]
MDKTLSDELRSFSGIWPGGYYEGDPMAPLSVSSYGQCGFVSVPYAIYLSCIRPYVTGDTVSLEIGPGRGAWTKCLLRANHVWVMDAVSEQENRFFEYLGHPRNVTYIHVHDFSCDDLPPDTVTYMFSFGCLCHVSPVGVREYARNLFPKLKSGCECFWMVSDYALRNRTAMSIEDVSVWRAVRKLLPPGRKSRLIGRVLDFEMRREQRLTHNQHIMPPERDSGPNPGRWYDLGLDACIRLLEECGYEIVEANVGASLRDPIVHFRKP